MLHRALQQFFSDIRGSRWELFGAGGGERLAPRAGIPLLARIPFDPLVDAYADVGEPVVWAEPERVVSRAILELARDLMPGSANRAE